MIEKNVKLYLGDGFPVRIPVSQYDTMWRFIFTIINGSVEWTIPPGAAAVLNGRKPDGNVIAISGTIADNKVTVDATEQMTVVAGEVVCELSIMSGGAVVGTANFVLAVEDAPKKDGEPISESDLSAYAEMIAAAGELVEEAQEIIEQGPFLPPGGTPGQVLTKTANGTEWGDVSGLPDGGSNGQVLTKTSDGVAWSDAGTPTQAQTNTALADYLDEHPEAVTNIPDRIKQALLACFRKVAWVDDHGQDYYDALHDALMNKEVLSISAVFTQGSAVISDTDDLDTLKQYLTVTASYDDGTTGEVTAYELSGTLTEGTSTITVSYGGKTASFTVTVTHFDWIPIARLSSEDLHSGGLSSSTRDDPRYINALNTRVCYAAFIDVSAYSGYLFKAEWTTTASGTTYYGINSYNATADAQVANGGEISASDTQAHGWYENGVSFQMETTLNNKPITTIRINWSCGASHNTKINASQFDDVVIYAKSPN